MSITDRVKQARDRIAAACARVSRSVADVHIVAVSKTQPASAVSEAVVAGVEAIGENRVQEAAGKRPLVEGATPWHLVGTLQRNKVKEALDLFDLIETVDRAELADRLQLQLRPTTRVLPVFLEVNIGAEAQKGGVVPEGLVALAEHVVSHCPELQIAGLMTVPPYDPDPERSRPYFAALRELADRLARHLGLPTLELSMGMSEDFEVAIEEGATWVRLGRILFGERRPPI